MDLRRLKNVTIISSDMPAPLDDHGDPLEDDGHGNTEKRNQYHRMTDAKIQKFLRHAHVASQKFCTRLKRPPMLHTVPYASLENRMVDRHVQQPFSLLDASCWDCGKTSPVAGKGRVQNPLDELLDDQEADHVENVVSSLLPPPVSKAIGSEIVLAPPSGLYSYWERNSHGFKCRKKNCGETKTP